VPSVTVNGPSLNAWLAAERRPLLLERKQGGAPRCESASIVFGVEEPTGARFDQLYDELWSDLRAYLRRRTANGADADDLLAEVFVVVWRRIDDVPAGADARPWIFGIARNLVRGYHRSRDRRSTVAERLMSELVARPASSPADPARTAELNRLAITLRAMEHLDDDDRELIALVAWDRMTHADISVVFGCSTNAVGIRLHRARTRLVERIAHLTEELN